MNSKKMKIINRKADAILTEWLKTLVSPEEAKGINIKTISKFMPPQSYYVSNTGRRLSTFSKKNIKKELKTMLSDGVDIDILTWQDFNAN